MKTWKKYIVVLAGLWMASLSAITWAATGDAPHPAAQTLSRQKAWQAIHSGLGESFSIAIMDGGRIVYSEGFGAADRESNFPVDKDTLFNIGSISKIYCSTAIMLLVDEGKVNLDQPVTRYIPEFTMQDERYRDITVRMLMNHSSGLPGGSYANSFGYQYHPDFLSETLATLSRSHLKHRPGERSVYCNDGFTLAEIIVEKVSGQKYDQFLSARIFQPLSLRNTGLGLGQRTDAAVQSSARYYDPKGRQEPLEVVSFLGSGGLSSTTEDLCRFADSFSTAGPHLLSPASLKEIKKNQPPDFWGKLRNPMISFGLGWDITELPEYKAQGLAVLGKSGGTNHYTSMLYTLPEQRISVAVTGAGPKAPAQEIALSVLTAYLTEKGLFAPVPDAVFIPAQPQPLPVALLKYQGYYAGDSGDIIKMSFDTASNTLRVGKMDGGLEAPLLSAVYNADFFHDSRGHKFYFDSFDQRQYFISSGQMDIILFEKIEPLSSPSRLVIKANQKQWLRRNAKAYEGTVSGTHIETLAENTPLEGYVDLGGVKKVISPTFAGSFLASMRDASELEFFDSNGRMWAWISGLIYMPSDLAPVINSREEKVTLPETGYNEWRKTGYDSIVSFTKPPTGRIIVFDNSQNILYDSIVDAGSVYAPAGSFIECLGNIGDVLAIRVTPITK